MKGLPYLILGVISLIYAFINNFNSATFNGFVANTAVSTLTTLVILILLFKSVQNMRVRKVRKSIGYFLFIVIIGFTLLLFSSSLCATLVTPDHFRTNIFTGQCEHAGGDPCLVNDPWYYEPDCDSDAVKLEVIKNTRYHDLRLQECEEYCEENDQRRFCDTTSRGSRDAPADIACDLLVECDKITCS